MEIIISSVVQTQKEETEACEIWRRRGDIGLFTQGKVREERGSLAKELEMPGSQKVHTFIFFDPQSITYLGTVRPFDVFIGHRDAR